MKFEYWAPTAIFLILQNECILWYTPEILKIVPRSQYDPRYLPLIHKIPHHQILILLWNFLFLNFTFNFTCLVLFFILKVYREISFQELQRDIFLRALAEFTSSPTLRAIPQNLSSIWRTDVFLTANGNLGQAKMCQNQNVQ